MDEMNQTLPEKPKTHMVMAIVSTVLSLITCTIYGILPGIVSIVFASQVSSKYNKGDYEGAQNNSKYAKIAWIISLVVTVAVAIYVATMFDDIMEMINAEMEKQKALQP